MNRNLSYVLLLAGGALAGAISGIFYPTTMAVRGAILGVSLNAALICINVSNRQSLTGEQPPGFLKVFMAALIFGFIGSLLINLFGMGSFVENNHDFPPRPTDSGLMTMIIGIGYSLSILSAYHLRWILRGNRRILAVSAVVVAGSLVAFVKTMLTNSANISDSLIISLFSGIPFTALWILSTLCFDPAWTYRRWKRRN